VRITPWERVTLWCARCRKLRKSSAKKSWLRLLELEKEGSLAAQTHFGLAALYRKQGNAAKAEAEMQDFRKLQKAVQPVGRTQ
jgi:ATP/maltotriose-dependent transcriptional regulator MalT